LSTVSTVTLPVNMALFNVCPHMLMRGIPAAIYSNSEARYWCSSSSSSSSSWSIFAHKSIQNTQKQQDK